MPLTPFVIEAAPGGSTVVLDGTDVTDRIAGFTLAVEGPGIPTLTVHARAGGRIDGQGVVRVVAEPEPADLMRALADWLETLDPQEIIPLVESRFVSISDHPIALTLQVLAELAGQATDG